VEESLVSSFQIPQRNFYFFLITKITNPTLRNSHYYKRRIGTAYSLAKDILELYGKQV